MAARRWPRFEPDGWSTRRIRQVDDAKSTTPDVWVDLADFQFVRFIGSRPAPTSVDGLNEAAIPRGSDEPFLRRLRRLGAPAGMARKPVAPLPHAFYPNSDEHRPSFSFSVWFVGARYRDLCAPDREQRAGRCAGGSRSGASARTAAAGAGRCVASKSQ